MPRTRTFRRVHLDDLEVLEARDYWPATRFYTTYDAGRVPVILVEKDPARYFHAAIAASMERK